MWLSVPNIRSNTDAEFIGNVNISVSNNYFKYKNWTFTSKSNILCNIDISFFIYWLFD